MEQLQLLSLLKSHLTSRTSLPLTCHTGHAFFFDVLFFFSSSDVCFHFGIRRPHCANICVAGRPKKGAFLFACVVTLARCTPTQNSAASSFSLPYLTSLRVSCLFGTLSCHTILYRFTHDAKQKYIVTPTHPKPASLNAA